MKSGKNIVVLHNQGKVLQKLCIELLSLSLVETFKKKKKKPKWNIAKKWRSFIVIIDIRICQNTVPVKQKKLKHNLILRNIQTSKYKQTNIQYNISEWYLNCLKTIGSTNNKMLYHWNKALSTICESS